MVDLITGKINLTTLDEKVLIVPPSVNSAILKRNLALRAGSINNFKCMSLRNFLADSVVIALPEKRLISNDERFWLFYKVLSLNKEQLDYFREVTDFNGFVRLLSTTTEELQLNRVEKHDFPVGKKCDEIFFLMEEYEKLKMELGYIDYPDALFFLNEKADLHLTGSRWYIEQPLSSIEKTFFEKNGFTKIELGNGQNEEKPIFSAYKVDTPYQETIQTIKSIQADLIGHTNGRPLKIGVMVNDYNSYFSHFDGLTKHLGLNGLFHFAKGVPLFSTSAGKLLAYYLEWAENNYSIYRWKKIVEFPSFKKEIFLEDGDQLVDFYRAVALIQDSGLVLFNNDFRVALTKHLDENYFASDEESDFEMERDENRMRQIRIAKKLVNEFHTIVTAVTPLETFRTLDTVFRNCISSKNNKAIAAVAEVFTELLTHESTLFEKNIDELFTILKEMTTSKFVRYDSYNFDSVIFGTLEDLYYLDFDKIYILGLSETGLPKKVYENPLLLDDEKKYIVENSGAIFQFLSDRYNWNDTLFNLSIQDKKAIIMSVPIRDMAGGRERLVSRYILSAYEQFTGEKFDFKKATDELGRNPISTNNLLMQKPEDSFYDYEVAASLLLNNIHIPAKGKLLGNHFIFTQNADEYRRHRRKATSFDEYFGSLNLQDTRELKALSASSLTKWVFCPYQYFLAKELGLKKLKDFTIEDLIWLDKLQFGDFLHKVFFKFGKAMKEKYFGGHFSRIEKEDWNLLNDAFETTLAEFKILYPVVSDVYYEIQLKELRETTDKFFEKEKENTISERCYFEYSFGMPKDSNKDSDIIIDEPVEIEIEKGLYIKIRGSIDRIDKVNGRYRIIDYKSGKKASPMAVAPFNGGQLIQAGLYPIVLVTTDKNLAANEFQYYYTSQKGDFSTLEFDVDKNKKHFNELLIEILKEIKKGNFVPVGTSSKSLPCINCDFMDICVEVKSSKIIEFLKNTPAVQRYKDIKSEKVQDGTI
jgi:ATP-dependent helicase/DNAse subunit B